ncbi:hypothetical protein [Falsibacillus pallidus]|uniref:Uncharacterized protein n=1 Tax=Falsibacillus pallidus TaxID=493781 RepID=A0A370G253_9BACI|nr:hypothetical protein [Falsibacillus pallidus]RDI37947.1 hypothetical protein DFR59_12045 [Falsibacillus pallidus]
MINSFRNSWRIYTGKFEGVALLSLTILLPLLLIDWYLLNIVYAFVFNAFTSALADFYYVFLTFIFFVVSQIPFIQFVKLYEQEGEIRYKNIFYVFITNAFSLFVYGICLSLLTSIGVMLFIIPGLVVLLFLFASPYEAILENRSVWKSTKTSIIFAKKKFFPLLFLIFFVSLVELIIGWISMYLIYSITPSLLAQVLFQMLLNLLVFPFLAIWVTYFYMEWKEKYQLA